MFRAIAQYLIQYHKAPTGANQLCWIETLVEKAIKYGYMLAKSQFNFIDGYTRRRW